MRKSAVAGTMTAAPLLRRLPHCVDAERILIGTVLVQNPAYVGWLQPECFVISEHTTLWRHIGHVIAGGGVADPVTLRGWLENDEAMCQAIGGQKGLVAIADTAAPKAWAEKYAMQIAADYHRRRLIEIGEDLINAAYAGDLQPADIINSLHATTVPLARTIPSGLTEWTPGGATDPMNIKWLWPERLITNRINLIVGMGDVGKDVLACTLAAVVTTGRAWPDGRDLGRGPGMVGYVSTEDEPADTIIPRLIAAGADRSRIKLWTALEPPTPDKITDLDMMIVSPLISILGNGDANSERDARAMIRPWQDAAEKSGVSIIGICHYNKKNDLAAVQRVLGSVGLVNSVRCIWAIERDPEERGRRLMLRLKGNLMKDEEATGLAFRIEHIGPWSQSIVCVWEKDEVNVTADEVHEKKRNGVKNKPASDWVVEFLESRGGMCEYGLIIELGTKEGYTEASIKKAKERNHRILSVKIPPKNKPSDPWWWQLSKLQGSYLEDGIR